MLKLNLRFFVNTFLRLPPVQIWCFIVKRIDCKDIVYVVGQETFLLGLTHFDDAMLMIIEGIFEFPHFFYDKYGVLDYNTFLRTSREFHSFSWHHPLEGSNTVRRLNYISFHNPAGRYVRLKRCGYSKETKRHSTHQVPHQPHLPSGKVSPE